MPAGAVIREPQVLSGITGRKGCLGGIISLLLNLRAQLENRKGNGNPRECEGCTELMV